MTNEQKIKSMSTEELAKLLDKYIYRCEECPAPQICQDEKFAPILAEGEFSCAKIIKIWLKAEADDND